MMLTEFFLKLIAALAGLFGVGTVLFKGWQNHDRKITIHETTLKEQEDKMKDMQSDFEKGLNAVNKKVDLFIAENKLDHKELALTSNQTKSAVYKIQGFLMGKESLNED